VARGDGGGVCETPAMHRRARPVVAVTTYPADEGGRVSLPREYLDAVRRAGGVPVLVPPGDDDPAALLARCDGVLLSGGGDVAPSLWGGTDHDEVYGTDHDRDRAELALARAAVLHGVPLFAICRGMQVLNVALGGTLHVHLPDVVGEAVAHRAPPREPVPHPIEVDASSLVASAMAATAVAPMSWHHQAVDEPGEGLRVVARAPDGVVEAVELAGHPWLAAVQWHPELTAATDRTQQALFDAFVAAAGNRS
jgi:putative glutamine amidotransferase